MIRKNITHTAPRFKEKGLIVVILLMIVLVLAIVGVVGEFRNDNIIPERESPPEIETTEPIDLTPQEQTSEPLDEEILNTEAVEETVDPDQLWLETFADYSVDLEHKDVISGKDITFASEVVKDGVPMPYALYTPSSAETIGGDVPLIVWLHGKGCGSTKIGGIQIGGLPRALRDWSLDGFNAYVVCPQLVNEWENREWFYDSAKEAVDEIVEELISEYNIDTDRIIIAGHSNGAMGALFMAAKDKASNQYYSAVVEVAGSFPGVEIECLKEMPARGYVGPMSLGESELNYYYTADIFANLIGKENVFILPADHARIGDRCFTLDEDGDNKSDLIEWMLRQYKKDNG